MNLPGNGAIIKLAGGTKPSYRVWTDYGEFDLPATFEGADKYDQFGMIASAVANGVSRYWNGDAA